MASVSDHGSSSRVADARDGDLPPTDSHSTVTARAPVLSEQGEEESLGNHRRLSGALSRGNESSTHDGENLFRSVPANAAADGDALTVVKDSEAHDTEDNRAAAVIATRLPEDSRYAFISDEEGVSAISQARGEGAGYAAEVAGLSRVGLGIGSDRALAPAPVNVGDRIIAALGLPPMEQVSGQFRDAVPGGDPIAGEPQLPDAREADLFAGFSPLDRAGLERAIDQLIDRLGGLDEELGRLGSWTDLIVGLVGVGIAVAMAEVIRRRLGAEWDDENTALPGEAAAWLPGLPGLPPPGGLED